MNGRMDDLPRGALFALGFLGLLGGGALLGVLLGRSHVAGFVPEPGAELRERARSLRAEVRHCVPDLMGLGGIAPQERLEEIREAAKLLKRRATETGIALDLSDVGLRLARAPFERALRARDFDAAERSLAAFEGRPEGYLLGARLALARGERPDHEVVRALTRSADPELQEAARLLAAHLRAEESPDEALDLLREGVRPQVAIPARAHAFLFQAVRALDVEALRRWLPEVHVAGARRRAASRLVAAGARAASARPLDVPAVERVLRCLRPLGERALATDDAAGTFVREVLAGVRAATGSSEVNDACVRLLEDLAAAGFRAPKPRDADALLDRCAATPAPDGDLALRRARLLVALSGLNLRVERVHLVGISPAVFARLPAGPSVRLLRARAALAAGGPAAAEAKASLDELLRTPEARALTPIERATAILLASAGAPAPERAAAVRRAFGLDPACPWVRVGLAEVYAREGDPAQAAEEALRAQVLCDDLMRGRPGENAARLRLRRELVFVHALRRDENLTEVFLGYLAEAGDPDLDATRARARELLAGK
ncbi:MAG: hypothetical protein D6731_07325 [Planctomycetota bacterium]|nr:MAG: hypothetical protein D6731_07325 [Planctomycetota bacterium]